MADCPSLMQYDALYGYGSSEYWIDIQVSGIFGASNSKEKGVADGIRIFCQSFASQVKAYKLSELMLFFARYKAGKYDNSFASFDARRIGNAFFKEFYSERNYELDAINRKRAQDEIENRKFIPPEGYSSLTLYNELKRRAESGDEEARKMLMSPMSMAKKIKPEIVYVKCRNCKNASDFGDNSAYCKAKGHRVCACDRYGQICDSFLKK